MRGPFILWALYQHLFEVWVVTRFLCGFIPRMNLMTQFTYTTTNKLIYIVLYDTIKLRLTVVIYRMLTGERWSIYTQQ